jgi:hypothetical protein
MHLQEARRGGYSQDVAPIFTIEDIMGSTQASWTINRSQWRRHGIRNSWSNMGLKRVSCMVEIVSRDQLFFFFFFFLSFFFALHCI